MSSVFRAHDHQLEREVAIKILHQHYARGSGVPRALPPRGARGRAAVAPEHRHGHRPRGRRRAAVHRLRARRGREPEGARPAHGPAAGPTGARARAPHRGRALVRARARARPPRREAAERPPQQRGRGQGDRLRHRALAPRGARRHADRDGARHRRVPRARAGEREAGLARDRRLLPRRRALGAAGGRRPVRRRQLRRGRAAPRQRAAAEPARAAAGRVAAARRSRAAGAGEGSGAPLPFDGGVRSGAAHVPRRPGRGDTGAGGRSRAHARHAASRSGARTCPPAAAGARSRRGPLFYALLALLVAGAAFAAVVAARRRGPPRRTGRWRRRLVGQARSPARRSPATTPTGDGVEGNAVAGDATDGSKLTSWSTETYRGPDFARAQDRSGSRPRCGPPREARAPDVDDADTRLHGGDPGRRLAERGLHRRLVPADRRRDDEDIRPQRPHRAATT